MIDCPWLTDSRCGLAEQLTGVEVQCPAGACETCRVRHPVTPTADSPGTVVASLATWYGSADVGLAMRPHLMVEKSAPLVQLTVQKKEAAGVGTEVSTILKSLGIPPCQQCAEFAEWMDEIGPVGCLEDGNHVAILTRLREKAAGASWWTTARAASLAVTTGLASKINWSDPAPGILDEAIRIVREREASTELTGEQRRKIRNAESAAWDQLLRSYKPQALVPRDIDLTKRHLIFHCFPKRGADWRAACLSTFRYRSVFNGRIIVSVTTGPDCDESAVVVDWFLQFGPQAEVTLVENVPSMGINTTFRNQLRVIQHEPGIVYKSHTKGISHSPEPLIDLWRDNLMKGCLANIADVNRKFRDGYKTYATFKSDSMSGASVMGQINGPVRTAWPGWHVPGACFWFAPQDIPEPFFKLPIHHYENEAFSCHVCPSELAYSLTPSNINFQSENIDQYLPQ